jgi:ABC-type antimicrobial peptide transport system permease subunit
MAVGARRGQVIWMVLRDSLILTATGVLMGIPLAAMIGKALASSLYGIQPLDVVSFTFAIAGVAVVAVAASMIPARRAASVDPLRALRAD